MTSTTTHQHCRPRFLLYFVLVFVHFIFFLLSSLEQIALIWNRFDFKWIHWRWLSFSFVYFVCSPTIDVVKTRLENAFRQRLSSLSFRCFVRLVARLSFAANIWKSRLFGTKLQGSKNVFIYALLCSFSRRKSTSFLSAREMKKKKKKQKRTRNYGVSTAHSLIAFSRHSMFVFSSSTCTQTHSCRSPSEFRS